MNTRRTSAATTTINLRRRSVLAVAGTAVIATASLGATATAYAKKGEDGTRKDVRTSVACGTGTLKLKAKTDDAKRLEIEAEVDSNKAGQEWTVTLTNDGKTVWTGKRVTAGPSGSFSVESNVAADGTDATPTDPTTTSTSTPSPSSSSSTTASPTDDSSSTTTTSPTTDDKGGNGNEPGDDKGGNGNEPGDDKGGKGTDDQAGTDDKGGKAVAGMRAAGSKSGDDKPGDDKGGDSKGKPAAGKHVIGVTATLGTTLSCTAKVEI